MRGYLTREQFLKSDLKLWGYQLEAEQEATKVAEEISVFNPAEVIYLYSEEKGKKYYENIEIKLKHPTLDIRAQYTKYKKKYSFRCENCRLLDNTSGYTRDTVARTLKEPQQVGVLTGTKIKAWIKYFEDLYKGMLEESQKNAAMKQAFIDTLKGQKVIWNRDKTAGEIHTNGIRYQFTIGDTYISEKIMLDYIGKASLETFLKLSDNKM